MDSRGVIGLTNIGNTCYGNSVLQAIRHQVDFTIYLLQGQHKELIQKKQSSEKTRLLESYSELVKQLWTESSTVNTRPFWSSMIPAAIIAGVEQLRMPIAHDAHEFLVFLLDQFHEAMAEEVEMVIKTDSSKKQTCEALGFWKNTFQKGYSPLVELLFALSKKTVQCENCKAESHTWETKNIFPVCVPSQADPISLLTLMKQESVETIEEYECLTCKPKRTNAKITHSLWRLGNWVIVVLKRNLNNGKRINTTVEIPVNTSFTEIFNTDSSEPSKTEIYDLFSTIHHHGSAGGGHYTAQAKHPVTGQWVHYDDERTYTIDQPKLDASTYIVMYRRSTAPKNQ